MLNMYAMSMTVRNAEIAWDTSRDGEVYGYHDQSECYIEITGRVRPSMWTTGTNARDWALYNDSHCAGPIASGHEEGLRNAKRAALEALNHHLTSVSAEGLASR